MSPITVLVVDDHPIVRQGVRSLLSNYPDIAVVAEAGAAPEALQVAAAHRPDVALVDIRLDGGDGIQLAKRLRRLEPAPRVIVLTSYDDDGYLMRALEADAHAFLLKNASDEQLVGAIRSVHHGDRLLSPALMDRVLRQFAELRRTQVLAEAGLSGEDRQLLAMLADGDSNAGIAAACHWSETSVKRKLQDIFAKLQVSSRAQAAAEAVRRGLV